MKLLLVKQDKPSLIELAYFLEKEGCQVTILAMPKAFEKVKNEIFDCIIISMGTEQIKELQLVEYLNDNNRKDGIIIISENTSTAFTLHCFDLGIDDFLNASFKIPILFAHLKAVVRRKQFNSKHKFHFTNLVVDFQLKTIYVSNNAVNFTQMEYDILMYLLANKNSVIDRNLLIQHIWSDSLGDITSYEFLFTHIKNIRKKLKLAKAEFVINNNYGVGYQIEEICKT
jgi:DNA-binding response OmpR family regulator